MAQPNTLPELGAWERVLRDSPERRTNEFHELRELTSNTGGSVEAQLWAHLRNTPNYSTQTTMWYRMNARSPHPEDLIFACRQIQQRNPGYWCKAVSEGPYSGGVWVSWSSSYWRNAWRWFIQ